MRCARSLAKRWVEASLEEDDALTIELANGVVFGAEPARRRCGMRRLAGATQRVEVRRMRKSFRGLL